MDLPYEFDDPGRLGLALTHSSTGEEDDNERLEFLGDAVLDLIVAEDVYDCHPDLSEGDLTELKAWVVSRRVLAEAALALGLDGAARVGSGMRGRALPRSVLANLFEAVLGAVYLDGGYEAARKFALAVLHAPLTRVRARDAAPNPKQLLQQISQLETGEPPRYVVLDQCGRAHARAFLVAVFIGERRFPSAWGRTRKEAERWAAHEALLVMQCEDVA